MKVDEPNLFMGLCFILSSLSKDKDPRSCLVVKKRRIISSGFSNIDSLGSLEGSPELFAMSVVGGSLSNYEIYLDHTPSAVILNYLSQFSPRRLTYFETDSLCTEEASLLKFDIIRFHGNLNWIRDRVASMKSFDIFG